MKLVKGKKLMVFFGCVATPPETPAEDEEKNVIMEYDEISRESKVKRMRIIQGLNQNVEAKSVSDLFVKLPTEILFNPITFNLHIPLSLQKKRYARREESIARVEDFELVYDGYLLMIFTLCDLDKMPCGVLDVRDRFLEILGSITKCHSIPPTIAPFGVTFYIDGEDVSKTALEELLISVKKPTESSELLRALYLQLDYSLGSFYGASSISQDISRCVWNVEERQLKLLHLLNQFIGLNWKDMCKKRVLISQGKKEMAEILQRVSEYTSSKSQLVRARWEYENMVPPESMCAKMISKLTFDFYTNPSSRLDISSVITTIEHLRNEFETYNLNTYALVSALLGAIIGSLITLLASQI